MKCYTHHNFSAFHLLNCDICIYMTNVIILMILAMQDQLLIFQFHSTSTINSQFPYEANRVSFSSHTI